MYWAIRHRVDQRLQKLHKVTLTTKMQIGFDAEKIGIEEQELFAQFTQGGKWLGGG